jgi:DNA-binding CsgD family transcriptional regulator
MDLVVPWGPIHAGLAEHAWLAGDFQLAIHKAHVSYGAVIGMRHAWFAGELAFWRWRAGDEFDTPDWITQPYAAQISGDWRGAAALWEKMGCPYEQGMALMDGDEAAQLAALQIFENLGAKPIIEKHKQQMRAQGMRGIPRGPRPSTRTNAFGLTARELDVLAKLVTGASNNSIAEQLSLSTRTVEHHLASILQKTGTQSRGEAVALALRENLVSPG